MRTNNNATNDYILLTASSAAIAVIESTSDLTTFSNRRVNTTFQPNGNTAFQFDFDLSPYLLPITMEGTALIRFCIAGDLTGGENLANFIAKVLLRKWDGSSETEITSDNTSAIELSAQKLGKFFTTLTVPRTHFKAGEQLRVSLELTYDNPGAARNITLAHDPTDAASAVNTGSQIFEDGTSRFVAAIPYKTNL